MTVVESFLLRNRNSQLLRLGLLGVLVLVLLLPVVMIRDLVAEREERNRLATSEVSTKFGTSQIITGPVLILPYSVRRSEATEDHAAVFLPRTMRAKGQITTESRARGIFAIPVYRLRMSIDGEFAKPNLSNLGIDPQSVSWERAQVAIGISDVRGLQEQSAIMWNGMAHDFLPGAGSFIDAGAGIHADVPLSASDGTMQFSLPLALNGSQSAYFVPFGEDTVVQMTSNFPSPNFQGSWLPTDRTVTATGFDATWRISYLGRSYSQSWISGANVRKAIEESRFGIEFSEPIDRYRMADRSLKYAGLFILLTFATIWLVEVLSKARVHPIQYLMLGAALCIFYLLELSLSEHIGFAIAYGAASLSIIVMLTAYSRVILTANRAAVPVGVAALYTYLFVLLTNEDGALLVGSIGLFVILAAVMYLTRGINWYANEESAAEL